MPCAFMNLSAGLGVLDLALPLGHDMGKLRITRVRGLPHVRTWWESQVQDPTPGSFQKIDSMKCRSQRAPRHFVKKAGTCTWEEQF